jgi:hypothetical protein
MGRTLRRGITTLGSIAGSGQHGSLARRCPQDLSRPSIQISDQPIGGRVAVHAFVSGSTVATGETAFVRRSIESCRVLTHGGRKCG